MARRFLFLGLVLLQVLIFSIFRARSPLLPETVPPANPVESQLLGVRTQEATSCKTPSLSQAPICAEIAESILASTLRVEMQGWVGLGAQRRRFTRGSLSHATMIGGRYLVTHHHFSFNLKTDAPVDGEGYTSISLRQTNGELVLDQAPLTTFSIVFEGPETLVLEFVDDDGNGLFEGLGLPSARSIDWQSVPWQIGLELAVFDWDGEVAHIDWVPVERFFFTADDITWIEIRNYAMHGASGGGAYWNGFHVGNIWARDVQNNPETHRVERAFTIVALNSAEMASQVSGVSLAR